ncbi:unnamed protein product [Diatraea saccharalis]|uniref:Uncharacterized protein n=1 Tax=Diatraea saccharalis TaxID=40085 RepID=A0A9N9R504_9NEOP|nr:unnamed protein product [Diatraea saccharalis]
MSLDTWKVEKGLCRCCHADGIHTNLAEPQLQKGQQEIYANIMQQCFNINLHPVQGPLCTITYSICDLCAQRLLDAYSFKKQVMQCEERFHNLYNKNMIKLTSSYEVDIKVEISDEDVEDVKPVICVQVDENNDFDFNNEDDDGDDSKEMQLDTEEEQSTTSQPKKPKAKPKAKGQTRKSERSAKAKQDKAEKAKKELRLLPDVAHCVEVIEDNGKKKLKCTKCWVERRYAHDMRRHIESAHKNEPELQIPPEDLDDYKVCEKDGKVKFSCNKCGAERASIDTMRNHMASEHFNLLTHECSLCKEKFGSKGTLVRHLAKKHSMKEVTVGRTKVLQKTMKVICNECNKVFNSRDLLTTHKKIHRMPECPECSLTFKRKEMAFHRNEVHGVPIPTCGICGYKTHRENLINKHQRQVHLRERNLPCPQCDAMFFEIWQLKKHLVCHNPVKKYECRFCKKTFPRLGTKREHEKIHTGVKNKVCSQCGDRFVQKASLNYHMMKHHPEVAY